MLGLIFAAQLAAVQPASNSVELTLSVVGSSEVPAQGYQVYAMMVRTGPSEAGDPDARPPLAELKELEAEKRDTCGSFYSIGFFGNDYYDETAEQITLEEATESLELPPFAPPTQYSGLFATREAADQALALLRPLRPTMLRAAPVLYNCDAALEQAKVDALGRSQQQAEVLAAAMGMKVAGIIKIEDEDDAQGALQLLSYYSARSGADDRTVATMARLRVTFSLVK